jgi:hypothetical protein
MRFLCKFYVFFTQNRVLYYCGAIWRSNRQKRQKVKTMAKKVVVQAVTKCSVCGKTLTRAQSITGSCGKLCAMRKAQGTTLATLAVNKQKFTITAAQASNAKLFISVAQLHRACVNTSLCTVSKMLKAMGGDTAMATPLHPIAQVFWCNGQRYVNSWLATQTGLNAMYTGNFSKAPKTQSATQSAPTPTHATQSTPTPTPTPAK